MKKMMLRFAQDMLEPIIKREADGNYFYVWPGGVGYDTDPVGPFPTYEAARDQAMKERDVSGTAFQQELDIQPWERQDAFGT